MQAIRLRAGMAHQSNDLPFSISTAAPEATEGLAAKACGPTIPEPQWMPFNGFGIGDPFCSPLFNSLTSIAEKSGLFSEFIVLIITPYLTLAVTMVSRADAALPGRGAGPFS
jgi:hypothetical protein